MGAQSCAHHVLIQKQHPTGMHVMQCKYFIHIFGGSPQRIRAHSLGRKGQGFAKCNNASDIIKQKVGRLIESASIHVGTNVNANTFSSFSSNGYSINASQLDDVSNKKKKIDMGGPLQMSWDMQLRRKVEEAVARFFYAEDIPHGRWKAHFLMICLKLLPM